MSLNVKNQAKANRLLERLRFNYIPKVYLKMVQNTIKVPDKNNLVTILLQREIKKGLNRFNYSVPPIYLENPKY